jgi:DNA-binding NtrC family response regulator
LVTGKTGAGKDVAAPALNDTSARAHAPFMAALMVSCACAAPVAALCQDAMKDKARWPREWAGVMAASA